MPRVLCEATTARLARFHVILSALLLREKDLGGPRDASRPVRGNNRAFGPLPLWDLPPPRFRRSPKTQKAPRTSKSEGALFRQVGYTKIILNIGNPSQVKSTTAQTLPKMGQLS